MAFRESLSFLTRERGQKRPKIDGLNQAQTEDIYNQHYALVIRDIRKLPDGTEKKQRIEQIRRGVSAALAEVQARTRDNDSDEEWEEGPDDRISQMLEEFQDALFTLESEE